MSALDDLTYQMMQRVTKEHSMKTAQEAFKAAVGSGAVEAYTKGEPIQWRLDIQEAWKTFDTGGIPDFFGSNIEWRVGPPPVPVVKWRNVKQFEPPAGHRCLISDGEEVRMDRWEIDDWKRRSKTYYPLWCPLPNAKDV